MPNPKYVPKHRGAPPKRVRAGATNVVKLSGVAAWATGITVVGGVASQGDLPAVDGLIGLQSATADVTGGRLSAADLAERQEQAEQVSRSGDPTRSLERAKKDALADTNGVARVSTEDLSVADPRTLAKALMPQYGLSSAEFGCLDRLWVSESNWNVHADNPSSSAYGIPQALPGSKMSSAGPDWQHSAETQIRWGLQYIKSRYGTACGAWAFKQGRNWY